MASSNRQYLRSAQVIVGKAGSGLSIKDLRIVFEITKDHQSAPNDASIKIYNLNDENQRRVRFEFEDVILSAGYLGSEMMLFGGNIKYTYRYREKNDWIVEIVAGDGDRDFRGAVVNDSFSAGMTDAQLVDRLCGTFGSTKKGAVKGVAGVARTRGVVMSGNTRAALDTVARQNDCNWSIQDGLLQIIPVNGVLDNEAIVVNSDTGMINAPEQDDKGIKVKTLLNPLFRINGRVKLDNDNIKRKKLKAGSKKQPVQQVDNKPPARLDPDGVYKIYKIVHKGDTRGPEWSSEAHTVSLDSVFPTK